MWQLAIALLVIALATLVPTGDQRPRFYLTFEPADVLVNILLYLPLGVILARLGLRPLSIALVALVLSGTIELVQGTAIPGRRGAPADVVANLAGAMSGLALERAMRRLRRSPSTGTLVAAAAVAAVPAIAWFISGALLTPAPPATPQWYGQWAHHFRGTERFRGSILSVAMQGQPVPNYPVASTDLLRTLAQTGPLTLEVALLSGGTTGGITHLASVASGEGGFIIAVEQLGDDLLLSWMSRGAALGLRPPKLAFPSLLRAAPGDRLTIHAEVSTNRAEVTVQGDSAPRHAARRLSALTGWRSFIPSRDLTAGNQRLFDVVWTLSLAGYVLVVVRVLKPLALSSRQRHSDPAA